jgi:hypothetical protein
VIHRTFRSLDSPPKLLGFSGRQWALLIAASAGVLGMVEAAGLPVKPAITLLVFLVGLPAALMYVSESGGMALGVLLADLLRWRACRRVLPAACEGGVRAAGLLVLAAAGEHRDEAQGRAVEADVVAELLAGERWRR